MIGELLAILFLLAAALLVLYGQIRAERLERERRWHIARWDGLPQAHPRTYRAVIQRHLRNEFAWPRENRKP